MATRDDISSTEKLLDLIRAEAGPGPESPPARPWKKARRKRSFSFLARKRVSVGVEFGSQELRLVKLDAVSERDWTLLGVARIPCEADPAGDRSTFASFLRDTLSDFVGRSPGDGIWAILPTSLAEIRRIKIPKLARKQIPTAVLWTFKKDVPFDEKESLLDFEILGEVTEGEGSKTAVNVYTAPKQEIAHFKGLFSEAGFPIRGLLLAPFAAQNLLRAGWLEPETESCCLLSVEEAASRIDIFSGRDLALTRAVRTGIHSMTETMLEGLRGRSRQARRPELVMESGHTQKEMKQAREILRRLGRTPVTGQEASARSRALFGLILPVLERLLWQVQRSLEYYALNSGSDPVGKIYLTGEITAFPSLVDYIRRETGVPIEVVDPFEGLPKTEAASGVREAGTGFFTLALGAALSTPDQTPNLLYGFEDKEQQAAVVRVNRGIFGVFVALMALGMGLHLWQTHLLAGERRKVAAYQKELSRQSPRLEQGVLMGLLAKAMFEKRALSAYAKRYVNLAVLGELARLTPANIRLLGVTIHLDTPEGQKKTAAQEPAAEAAAGGGGGGPSSPPRRGTLVLEGLVLGESKALEPSLAAYLFKLERNPLLRRPHIDESRLERVRGKKALHFTVSMGIV